MDRRTSLKLIATGGVITGLGISHHLLTRPQVHPELAIHVALERLSKLNFDSIDRIGDWESSRTLNHLAQSIDFSMSGYPEMKSEVFQKTVGQLAFSVFQARGRMSHNLGEAIPGEIIDQSPTSASDALNRLLSTLERFEGFQEELQPHFAYGSLTKDQYAIAHVMHINDHLAELNTV